MREGCARGVQFAEKLKTISANKPDLNQAIRDIARAMLWTEWVIWDPLYDKPIRAAERHVRSPKGVFSRSGGSGYTGCRALPTP